MKEMTIQELVDQLNNIDGMFMNMVVLASYPAKYKYKCDQCGYIDYQYG